MQPGEEDGAGDRIEPATSSLGNYFVTLAVATLGLFVGVILGIVHRNE